MADKESAISIGKVNHFESVCTAEGQQRNDSDLTVVWPMSLSLTPHGMFGKQARK